MEENDNLKEKLLKNYVEQCFVIKKEIYELLSQQHSQSKNRMDEYRNEVKNILYELQPLKDEAVQLKNELKDILTKIKKSLKEEVEKLKEQYELGSICINTITKRMDDLESYIKNERFHNLVKEINALEDKFEQEAIKIVQNRMKK